MPRPKKRRSVPKTCPNCGKPVEGHPNKKYCSRKCGVEFWDTVAPGKLDFLRGRRAGAKQVSRSVRASPLLEMIERKRQVGGDYEDDY